MLQVRTMLGNTKQLIIIIIYFYLSNPIWSGRSKDDKMPNSPKTRNGKGWLRTVDITMLYISGI